MFHNFADLAETSSVERRICYDSKIKIDEGGMMWPTDFVVWLSLCA